jgi:hypothetical protein
MPDSRTASAPSASAEGRKGPRPAIVGITGVIVAVALLVPVLQSTGWNPTLLIAFGSESTANLAYAASLLGDVDARADLGHDGRFFFAQAVDPWLTAPDTLRSVLDLPIYRTQRMLYPTVAGVLGLASPPVVVWMLVIVNVVSFGVGTWVTALVARGMGASSLWGLAFTINLGVWSELVVSGAGVLALTLALGAVAALQRGHTSWATAASAGSALSREVMVLAAVGMAAWLWKRGLGRSAALVLGGTVGAVSLWATYVRWRLGWASGLLGDDVDNRLGKGHDGKFFFAQANDPWLLEPETHAATLDRPVYRSQRMLYPMLAGGFGLFGPWAVVWGLLTVSVLAIAAGTYATALVAEGMGASAWWGLAFGLNIGVVSELLVGGGGHLGFGLVMFAIAAIQRGKVGWSVAALSGAVLTREVMLVAVAGIAVWLWTRHGWRTAVARSSARGGCCRLGGVRSCQDRVDERCRTGRGDRLALPGIRPGRRVLAVPARQLRCRVGDHGAPHRLHAAVPAVAGEPGGIRRHRLCTPCHTPHPAGVVQLF